MPPLQTIHVAIADDHTLFRKGLQALLINCDGFKVIGEAANGIQAVTLVHETSPDILLLDWDMPLLDGAQVLKKLKGDHSQVKCIVISFHKEDNIIVQAIKAGAGGFLTKDAEPEEIILAIRHVMEHGFYFNEASHNALLHRVVKHKLQNPSFTKSQIHFSEKEMQVLRLLSEECTAVEIGHRLFMSERTVEGIRQQMIRKVGAKNIIGLLIHVFRHEIIEL